MGAFGEWEVPLYYSTVIEEHQAVRSLVGIFDISHMGEIYVEGSQAKETLNYIVTNRMERLSPGKALYSPVCNEHGGIVDDVIVYELDPERYLVIVNASNVEKDYEWFLKHCSKDVKITNRSNELGLLAIQGPKSALLLQKVFSSSFKQLAYYSMMQMSSPWEGVLVARTGYTGELGFEIVVSQDNLEEVYSTVMEKGKEFGIKPIGFGARDTLRLEAAMFLYGQDMDDTTTPLEAGLERTVVFEKEFVGRKALLAQKEAGVSRKLVGFEMLGHGLARHGYPVYRGNRQIGQVTSGSFAPTLKKNIGLAYLAIGEIDSKEPIDIQIRSNQISAQIVKLPFYQKKQGVIE